MVPEYWKEGSLVCKTSASSLKESRAVESGASGALTADESNTASPQQRAVVGSFYSIRLLLTVLNDRLARSWLRLLRKTMDSQMAFPLVT